MSTKTVLLDISQEILDREVVGKKNSSIMQDGSSKTIACELWTREIARSRFYKSDKPANVYAPHMPQL